MSTLTAGKIAPAFALKGLDGKKHALKDALAWGPVLAAFFKVNCPTCQYTLPLVERLYQQFRLKGAHIWAISQDDVRDSQRFAKECGLTYPILIDDYPYETSRKYGLDYVPTLFLIAPDGHVQLASEGFAKADLMVIQKALAKHFSVPAGELFQPREQVPEYKPG